MIIGGWGVSPTGKSDSVRLRCDAKLCVPVRGCCFRGWVVEQDLYSVRATVSATVPVPFACLIVS